MVVGSSKKDDSQRRPLVQRGVPFALDETGHVASPWTAPTGAQYSCMSCSERVIVRRGAKRRAHFAHLPESACTVSFESIEHAAFKRLLVQGIRGHRRFEASFACRTCGYPCRRAGTIKPGAVVEEEVPVDPFRIDVAVLRQAEVVLAIEVYVTHEVGEEKARRLAVPWLEVYGCPEEILDLSKMPTVKVRATNMAGFCHCLPCMREADERAKEEALRRQRVAQAEEARARRRPRALVPTCWVTAFTPDYTAYRGVPLVITVQKVRLLVHPGLLPYVVLSQDSTGIYLFRTCALRHVDPSGRETSCNHLLGRLLEKLLSGRRTATPGGLELLEDVRPLLSG